MKVFIVEDSRLARQELKSLLEAIQDVELVGEAVDGQNAPALIQKSDLDVLLLDIHLPGRNGFEVLEALDEVPQVIFTTAFDEYAIQSFEYNTIDYLLKPIKKERLEKALDKVRPKLKGASNSSLSIDSQVFVKDGEKCWFVSLKEIRIFESYGNYTRVYFNQNNPLILKSLNYLESVLNPQQFFRVNRQQIINLHYVAGIASWFNGRLKLKLSTGEIVEVSRRQSNRIKDLFSF